MCWIIEWIRAVTDRQMWVHSPPNGSTYILHPFIFMGLQTSLDFFSTEGVSHIGVTGEQEGIGRQILTEQEGRSGSLAPEEEFFWTKENFWSSKDTNGFDYNRKLKEKWVCSLLLTISLNTGDFDQISLSIFWNLPAGRYIKIFPGVMVYWSF